MPSLQRDFETSPVPQNFSTASVLRERGTSWFHQLGRAHTDLPCACPCACIHISLSLISSSPQLGGRHEQHQKAYDFRNASLEHAFHLFLHHSFPQYKLFPTNVEIRSNWGLVKRLEQLKMQIAQDSAAMIWETAMYCGTDRLYHITTVHQYMFWQTF